MDLLISLVSDLKRFKRMVAARDWRHMHALMRQMNKKFQYKADVKCLYAFTSAGVGDYKLSDKLAESVLPCYLDNAPLLLLGAVSGIYENNFEKASHCSDLLQTLLIYIKGSGCADVSDIEYPDEDEPQMMYVLLQGLSIFLSAMLTYYNSVVQSYLIGSSKPFNARFAPLMERARQARKAHHRSANKLIDTTLFEKETMPVVLPPLLPETEISLFCINNYSLLLACSDIIRAKLNEWDLMSMNASSPFLYDPNNRTKITTQREESAGTKKRTQRSPNKFMFIPKNWNRDDKPNTDPQAKVVVQREEEAHNVIETLEHKKHKKSHFLVDADGSIKPLEDSQVDSASWFGDSELILASLDTSDAPKEHPGKFHIQPGTRKRTSHKEMNADLDRKFEEYKKRMRNRSSSPYNSTGQNDPLNYTNGFLKYNNTSPVARARSQKQVRTSTVPKEYKFCHSDRPRSSNLRYSQYNTQRPVTATPKGNNTWFMSSEGNQSQNSLYSQVSPFIHSTKRPTAFKPFSPNTTITERGEFIREDNQFYTLSPDSGLYCSDLSKYQHRRPLQKVLKAKKGYPRGRRRSYASSYYSEGVIQHVTKDEVSGKN